MISWDVLVKTERRYSYRPPVMRFRARHPSEWIRPESAGADLGDPEAERPSALQDVAIGKVEAQE
jgi:hypothetical protein